MEIQIFMLVFPLVLSSFNSVGVPNVLNLLCRRYMAEILPIRRKTLSNQSVNQSMYCVYKCQRRKNKILKMRAFFTFGPR